MAVRHAGLSGRARARARAPGTYAIHHSLRGFSLAELAMTLAVAAVLFGVGAPAWHAWIASQQLANHAHLVMDALNLARSEAIKRGMRVSVCKTLDRARCADDGGWDQGWILFVDDNQNGDVDEDESVLHIEGPAENRITVFGNRPVEDYVSYTSLGHPRMLNGALQMGTFVVCKPGQNAIEIVLANSGRARMEATTRSCS